MADRGQTKEYIVLDYIEDTCFYPEILVLPKEMQASDSSDVET